MTKAQKILYFVEFQKAVKHCRKNGLPIPDRHALHVKALGFDLSSKLFTEPQFDKVMAEIWAISRDTSVKTQLRQINQPRTRMIHKIINDLPPRLAVVLKHPEDRTPEERIAAAETYILAIMRQKYKAETCSDLKDDQLHHLIIDISRAINKRRVPLHLTCAEVETHAETLLFKLTHAHAA
jgi:hypothetical protein